MEKFARIYKKISSKKNGKASFYIRLFFENLLHNFILPVNEPLTMNFRYEVPQVKFLAVFLVSLNIYSLVRTDKDIEAFCKKRLDV